jgi:DNA adenine methylase
MKPLFMWAGGKTRLLKHYRPLLPATVSSYVEPFFGGGALYASLKSTNPAIKATINDVNGEIMRIYQSVRDDVKGFEAHLKSYADLYLTTKGPTRKAYYYELRTRYWTLPSGVECDALLYFLLKTCFNGIWQSCVSANGKFGTPVGLFEKHSVIYNPQALYQWSAALQNANIVQGAYDKITPSKDSFIFCDPPYRGSFTTYNTVFGDPEQVALVRWCQALAAEGHIVWLANRDVGDGFYEKLAPEATIHRFDITYTAGRRKKTEAGFVAMPAVEMLMVWN